MSSDSVSSSTSSSVTTTGLTSLAGSSTLQVTGLASGLNTNEIITELMASYQAPVTALQNQQTGVTDQDTQLTSIQSALQSLASDASALGDPSLFSSAQAVTSSNPDAITATSSTGAGVGGYEVNVTQLANSAQRTFTFASPTASAGTDNITIDGQQMAIKAGESISDFVNAVNSNSNLDVYAAATDSNTVVLSSRATGDTGANFIQVADSGGALTEVGTGVQGQDAQYTVGSDPTVQSSASNTVTSAIPGVTLTFTGLTTTTGPATIDVAPPSANSTNVEAAINTFVTQYNSVISQIQTALAQPPSSSDPSQGTLYDDSELQGLLGSMRSMMYTDGKDLTAGMSNMTDIGVSTGATTGSGAVSATAVAGNLTLDASTLTSALQSNASGVQSMLTDWSIRFSSAVNTDAAPGGTISSRLTANQVEISQMNVQISSMQSALTDKQNQLVNEFAQMESALSENQSEASQLTSQIAQL